MLGSHVGVDSKALLRILEQGKAISDPANQPTAGFVIKTWDDAGSKVFINVCHSPRIPLPARWLPEGELPAKLNELGGLDSAHVPVKQQGTDDDCLCIPMVFSPPRPDVDHSGNSCAVFDCGVHPQVIKACKDIRAFKMHLIGMILRAATEKSNIYLSPEFRLPKMNVRGVIPLLSDWGLSEYENGGVTCEKETVESDDGGVDAITVNRGGTETVDIRLDSSKITTSYLGKPVRAVKIHIKLPLDVCERIKTNPENFRVFSRGSEVLLDVPGCRQVCIETNLSLDGSKTTKSVCDLKQKIFVAEIPIQSFEKMEWIDRET